MTCDDVRLALSARLDGEDPGRPVAALEAHLAACRPCERWQQEAARLARAVRAWPGPVPDLTGSIMNAVAAPVDGRRRDAVPAAPDPASRADVLPVRTQALRVAVATAAVIQFALAVPALVAPSGAAGGAHVGREMASFDMAVAVGFLLAAYRPTRARGYVPVALVLALCLAVTSIVDLARGAAVAGHEIGHLAALVQAMLLYGLGRADAAGAGRRMREVAT